MERLMVKKKNGHPSSLLDELNGQVSFVDFDWDVSGFVRLFYILSKNKIFRIFGRHILAFWPIISRFS